MKRISWLPNLVVIFSLVFSLITFLVSPSSLAKADFQGTSLPGDMFVIGIDKDYNNPILFRMDTEGAVIWQQNLPFTHFSNNYFSADRNLTEDSFYMVGNSYFRTSQIDGKNRILKYDSQGANQWDLPLSPNANVLSANPNDGGAYVADDNLGIYKISSEGSILWGPNTFGYSGATYWAVVTDTTDGGAFILERQNNIVIKIDANANVIWTQTVVNPGLLNPCPTDGGVYVGAGSYAVDTYKLGHDGNIEWTLNNFSSLQNNFRNINPFDSSLFVYGSWPSKLGKASPDGTVPWNLDSDLKGGANFAVEMHENGNYLYYSENWDHLGITKINASDGSVVWRRDPGFYTYTGGDTTPGYIVYSGLPADPSEATLSASTTSSNIYPGDEVSIDLNINGASSLYAAQTTCTVDPAVLHPLSGTFGPLFDPNNMLIAANQVDAGAGTWTGAISLRSPATPISGGGLFSTIAYTASGAGTTAITCDPLLSDIDGFTEPVVYTGINVTVLPYATLSGIAQFKGRLLHDGITVTATGVVTKTASTNSAGNYTIIELREGPYQVNADASRYLPSCTTITLTSGQTATLPNTKLKGGDANDDGSINIGDAALVAGNFGLIVPPADVRADINNDTRVNIQDLAILGGNFGLSGCQTW
jgi:hypothetical protein